MGAPFFVAQDMGMFARHGLDVEVSLLNGVKSLEALHARQADYALLSSRVVVDVDLAGGRLTVARALQRQRGRGMQVVEPKSAAGRRTVFLSQVAVTALRAHRARQRVERLAAGPLWQDTGLVFTTTRGTPLDVQRVDRHFRRALVRAGLPRVRVHDLRHTAATLLLASGTHPKVVQELLGHATIAITLGTYAHTVPAMHRQAVAHFDALFARQCREREQERQEQEG